MTRIASSSPEKINKDLSFQLILFYFLENRFESWTFFGRDFILPEPFFPALDLRQDSLQRDAEGRRSSLVVELASVVFGCPGLLGPRSNIGLLFVGGSCRVFLVSSCFGMGGKKT